MIVTVVTWVLALTLFFFHVTGNGKVKVKEPIDLAEKAMKQLTQAIDLAKSAVN